MNETFLQSHTCSLFQLLLKLTLTYKIKILHDVVEKYHSLLFVIAEMRIYYIYQLTHINIKTARLTPGCSSSTFYRN